MAQRNRQIELGANFWLSNAEQAHLVRLLKNAKKNLPNVEPRPGDFADEAGLLDDFANLFDPEARNGEFEII